MRKERNTYRSDRPKAAKFGLDIVSYFSALVNTLWEPRQGESTAEKERMMNGEETAT